MDRLIVDVLYYFCSYDVADSQQCEASACLQLDLRLRDRFVRDRLPRDKKDDDHKKVLNLVTTIRYDRNRMRNLQRRRRSRVELNRSFVCSLIKKTKNKKKQKNKKKKKKKKQLFSPVPMRKVFSLIFIK
jgi:hypothetical protein